ncbi:hypothetical protein Prudu_010221 [Prunus dulcis]|uniref:Uncharacterized protein n=1 Tax=Prunus dulcis TaxID=3755 RepID=A0A4Y1R817_PRUDU|nr:hypothetical protein Prudu_010221 [Prunus dulcis]
MGTEVQSKMYLPGYYSVQKLSSNVGHGSWSLLHENKNLKNGQQYELFLTRPIMDGFHGRDKEQMRQTILKHESVFRHQIKSKELLKHQNGAETSLSTFSSSGFPNEDDRNSRHNSNLPLVDSSFGRPCTSSTGISQSPCNFIGKTLQTSGAPAEVESPMNTSVMEKNQEEISWGQVQKIILLTQARDDILSNHIGETSGYNNIDRVSASTSVFKFGNDFSSREEIERQVLSANAYKGVWPFAKEFPENPQMEKDGRFSNLHLKNERHQKEWSTMLSRLNKRSKLIS